MKRRDEFRGYSLLSAGVCELVYTFMLCFVVLNVAAAKKNKEPRLEGLGVELHDLSIWARRNSLKCCGGGEASIFRPGHWLLRGGGRLWSWRHLWWRFQPCCGAFPRHHQPQQRLEDVTSPRLVDFDPLRHRFRPLHLLQLLRAYGCCLSCLGLPASPAHRLRGNLEPREVAGDTGQ